MKTIRIAAALALLSATASIVDACQVPVFRYALERWSPDRYEIVIVHEGPLSADQEKLLDGIRESASSNRDVRVIRPTQIQDPKLRQAWETGDGQPMIASLYPKQAKEVPERLIATAPLSSPAVPQWFDSPLRRKIADRIVSGESAVWIFVPCGDDEQDRVALKTLKTLVEHNELSLKLPEQEEVEDETELLEQVDIELRLDFSIVTLDRNDPNEQFLVKSLLHSEPDLTELDQPMAFPVLGRGRVLYALVGRGINEANVSSACRFIIGPCSCQVKNQNPGFDLLMPTEWEERIGKGRLSEPVQEAKAEPIYLTIPPGRSK